MSPNPSLMQRANAAVARRISIDTRTLALFRVVVGVLVVADIITRAARFGYFYTEGGVVPQALARDAAREGAFSFYFFTTSSTITAALFAVQIIVGLALVVGYRTRVAAVLAFLFVISLDHRNPLINSYADTLLRLLLLWAMFLPLAERWSIDAMQAGRLPRSRVTGLATAAILIQMVWMYLANGLQKRAGGVWNSGEAVTAIFGLDDITFLFGDAMRAFPDLLELGGSLWYYMLLGAPALLVLSGRIRLPIVGLYLVGHLAFALTVRIGAFPYVAIAGVLLFLQDDAWTDGRRLLRAVRLDRPVDTARRQVAGAARWLAGFLPGPARRPAALLERAGKQVLVATVAVVLVIPALDEIADSGGPRVAPASLRRGTDDVAAMFGVRQPPWTVFAPRPRHLDRWFVFAAQTADGEWLDVYNDRPLSFERPYRQLQLQYRTYRERFYMNSVRRDEGGPVTQQLASYLCARWRDDRDTELIRIHLYVISEQVTADTVDRPEERERSIDLISRHRCSGAEQPPSEP